MNIIGLGHYSRTGKDTLANAILASLHEYQPTYKAAKIPFAWKLKQICYDLYSWDGLQQPEFYDYKENEHLRDVKLPTIGKTPVEIWVAMGTPAVRENVYQNTWIDFVLNTDHGLDTLVIPDVRFPNEVEAVRAMGGTLIKVVRPGYGPRPTVADRALVGYDGWDYIVGGSGAMDELRSWGSRLTHWITGGLRPVQTASERKAASRVEVITPYEPKVAA